jgi:hypothetical protein
VRIPEPRRKPPSHSNDDFKLFSCLKRSRQNGNLAKEYSGKPGLTIKYHSLIAIFPIRAEVLNSSPVHFLDSCDSPELRRVLQVIERFGERGRNRTYNLLFFYQPLRTNGFNDFPNVYVGGNGQFEARLLRTLLRTLELSES